jgi:predicted nucleic-acid-binding Zn-ribbon protein
MYNINNILATMTTRKNTSRVRKYKRKTKKNATLRGGRTLIASPKIRYTKGSSTGHTLSCTKCGKGSFVVKTLKMGTKVKSLFGLEILDNRFKVFTCGNCGFVQLYSNNITCNDKQCDPLYGSN